MLGFQLLHQKKASLPTTPAIPAPAFLFETCLRRIWIVPEGVATEPGALTDSEAYGFLLEVISGLHSPIFGETEILGQFKSFLESHRANPDFAFFLPWSRLLLEDVKSLRTRYLRGQGQHSYGSLLRKSLGSGEKIWILGAGQLTESLLPWLSAMDVTLWVRDPAKARRQHPSASVRGLDEAPPDSATVVVAAPLAETDLARLLERTRAEWIDLREKSTSASLRPPRMTLADLFQATAAGDERKAGLREAVLASIRQLSVERLNRAWFRPQGWEDMCAS